MCQAERGGGKVQNPTQGEEVDISLARNNDSDQRRMTTGSSLNIERPERTEEARTNEKGQGRSEANVDSCA